MTFLFNDYADYLKNIPTNVNVPEEFNIKEGNNSKFLDVVCRYYQVYQTNDSKYMTNDIHKFIEKGYYFCPMKGVFVNNQKLVLNLPPEELKAVYFNNPNKDRISKNPHLYGEKSRTFLLSEGLQYTFGVEIETIRGKICPEEFILENINSECHRDGSLKEDDGSEWGGEYVTGVLTGDSGFKNLQKLVLFLQKRCRIDSRCGIHVHVGGANFNNDFSILAYILAAKIQEEMYSVVSKSRRDNSTCHKLSLNLASTYLKNLKEMGYSNGIDFSYEDFFKRLANKRELSASVNKRLPHPGGRYTDRYTNGIDPKNLFRYAWLNFIPCNFNTRNAPVNKKLLNEGIPYTLEFRSHQASLNYKKIRNWILFCLAFVNFVENNKNEILFKKKISIADILTATYPKKSKELIQYFESRKNELAGENYSEDKSEYTEFINNTEQLLTVKDQIQCV
jgi:hypothetical protein